MNQENKPDLNQLEADFGLAWPDYANLSAEEKQALLTKIETGADTQHPIKIEPMAQADIPDIHSLLAKYEQDVLLQIFIVKLYRFLTLPIVQDGFDKDDDARDEWEKQINNIYGEAGKTLVERNRMKVNALGEAISTAKMMADELKSPELQRIASSLPYDELVVYDEHAKDSFIGEKEKSSNEEKAEQQPKKRYKTYSFEEKRAFVEKTSQIIEEFINAL